jgi:hypothetical protein
MLDSSIPREVNRRIRATIESLHAPADGFSYDFLCTCGCLGLVRLTRTEYDATGGVVLVSGHVPADTRARPTG